MKRTSVRFPKRKHVDAAPERLMPLVHGSCGGSPGRIWGTVMRDWKLAKVWLLQELKPVPFGLFRARHD